MLPLWMPRCGDRADEVGFERAEFGVVDVVESRQPAEQMLSLAERSDEQLANRRLRPVGIALGGRVQDDRLRLVRQSQMFDQAGEVDARQRTGTAREPRGPTLFGLFIKPASTRGAS